MVQNAHERRASLAVAAELHRRGWKNRNLSDATGKRGGYDKPVDVGTIGDFLNGSRWPRRDTLARFERVLGWPPGSIEEYALEGGTPAWVSTSPAASPTVRVVDPAVLDDLEPSEAVRVLEYIALLKASRPRKQTRVEEFEEKLAAAREDMAGSSTSDKPASDAV